MPLVDEANGIALLNDQVAEQQVELNELTKRLKDADGIIRNIDLRAKMLTVQARQRIKKYLIRYRKEM